MRWGECMMWHSGCRGEKVLSKIFSTVGEAMEEKLEAAEKRMGAYIEPEKGFKSS